MVDRTSLVVYFRNPKAVKHIAEFGKIKYYTKKGKYAILYLNREEIPKVKEQLKKIKLVRRVEESLFENDEYQLEFDVK
jgi:uncharacterized protein YlbG (UPF0298 family)